MKFKDWDEKITGMHTEALELVIADDILFTTTTLKAGSNAGKTELTVRIGFSGSPEYRWNRDEWQVGLYSLKSAYSTSDHAYQQILTDLRTKLDMAKALHEKMLGIYAEPYLKDAVVARMRGINVSGNEEVISNAFKVQIMKIAQMTRVIKEKFGCEFTFALPKIGTHNLTLRHDYLSTYIQFQGQEYTLKEKVLRIGSIKNMTQFLLDYPKIEEEIQEFLAAWQVFEKVLEKED